MFLTVHVKTVELDVVSVVAIAGDAKIKIKNYKDKIFEAIKSGRFSCIRIIFERNTNYKGVEYHCVDFTGRSFIVVDPSGSVKDTKATVDWVAAQDIKYGLTSHADIVTNIIGPEKHLKRPPTTSEEYFHTYIRTEVQNFFHFPLENNNTNN